MIMTIPFWLIIILKLLLAAAIAAGLFFAYIGLVYASSITRFK